MIICLQYMNSFKVKEMQRFVQKNAMGSLSRRSGGSSKRFNMGSSISVHSLQQTLSQYEYSCYLRTPGIMHRWCEGSTFCNILIYLSEYFMIWFTPRWKSSPMEPNSSACIFIG